MGAGQTGFDGYVKDVATTYVNRGMVNNVTAYDSTTDTNIRNQARYIYDSWGEVQDFFQCNGAAVLVGTTYGVEYSYETSSGAGGNVMRRRNAMSTFNNLVDYSYGTADEIDDCASRITSLADDSVTRATYSYLEIGDLAKTTIEVDAGSIANSWYSSSGLSASYGNIDRWSRVTGSVWKSPYGVDMFHVAVTYDAMSNVTVANDQVFTWMADAKRVDVKYTMDSLNRLIEAQQGKLVTGSITAGGRDELWTLGQTGTFEAEKLDLTNGSNYTDAGEHSYSNTFNQANEWLTRGSTTYTVNDAVGNVKDDGVRTFS